MTFSLPGRAETLQLVLGKDAGISEPAPVRLDAHRLQRLLLAALQVRLGVVELQSLDGAFWRSQVSKS